MKKPAHAHLRIALPLHFLSSFPFSVFMGRRSIRLAVVLSPTLFPSEELGPQWGHIQLLPGDKFSSQHCFFGISHLSSLTVRLSFTRPCDPLSVTMPPQLFVLVCSSRLMLEELYNERFRGRKLLSCLAFPFINHRFTDLLFLQTAPPPPFPKALPVQRRATLALPSLGQSVQGAERSRAQHGRQILHLPFHSEYTQRAESRHAASESHTSPGEDWLLAVVTTRMQAR